MGKPNVLTDQTSPVSVPNPVTGVLIGGVDGVPNIDSTIEGLNIINSTLLTTLLAILMQQKFSPNTKSSFRDEYDYIIVGAGAAGSVLANRLSEKECVTVLLLEAGKTPPVLSEVPGLAGLMLTTDINWHYWTEPQEHTAEEQYEKRIPYDCGKGLGGSSLVNLMLYSRGNKQDYDDWEAMGAKGWSYKDVMPYFLKLENNTDVDLVADGSCHNVSGPVTFGRPRYSSYLRKPVIEGAKSLGYEVVDVNCKKQLGFADLQTFTRHGQRCSAAKAYLVPVDDRLNLDIVTQALVTKIEISNKTARGVCMDHKGTFRCVKAKREVIVSAGAVSSVKLLMLSGIGPRKTLEKLEIPLHADLPVGSNLQDHVTTSVLFAIPGVPFGAKALLPASLEEYIANRSGPLASPQGIFSIGFHRSADAATPEGVPNFESYFGEGDINSLRLRSGMKPLTLEKIVFPYDASATMWCFSSVLKPKSRGFVTINSTNPLEDPIIDPKFLSHPQDVEDLVAGLKMCLDVAETPEVQKIGVKLLGTNMPGCENLDYVNDRDKFLKCYVGKFSLAFWHPAGTAKMGSKCDPTTVVDPKFRVKGIKKLRVICAAAMPEVVSGNTMVPTMMMAEKGSDMIKETIRCC